jgi:hypothetical protein
VIDGEHREGAAQDRSDQLGAGHPPSWAPNKPETATRSDYGWQFQSRARREDGEDALALDYLAAAGATVVKGQHHRHHYPVDAELLPAIGGRFVVLAHGNIGDSSRQPGLQRPDTLAKVAHRALMLAFHDEPPVPSWRVCRNVCPPRRASARRVLAAT